MTKEELLKKAKELKNENEIKDLINSSGLEISDEELNNVSAGCDPDEYGHETPDFNIGDRVWWRDYYNTANTHCGIVTSVSKNKSIYKTPYLYCDQICFFYSIKEEKHITPGKFTGKEFKDIPECNMVMD